MYESPIKVIFEDAQRKYEDGIYQAIQKFDIYVDRDELLKALQYDRGQYEKGLADAARHGHWTHERLASTTGGTYPVIRCSVCKVAVPIFGSFPYCPNCGAKMDESEEEK